jgi:hypothetical protein
MNSLLFAAAGGRVLATHLAFAAVVAALAFLAVPAFDLLAGPLCVLMFVATADLFFLVGGSVSSSSPSTSWSPSSSSLSLLSSSPSSSAAAARRFCFFPLSDHDLRFLPTVFPPSMSSSSAAAWSFRRCLVMATHLHVPRARAC